MEKVSRSEVRLFKEQEYNNYLRKIKKMREKPEFDYLVNTGFYLAEPLILKHVPKKSFFNMDDLINNLRSKKLKIGVYPVRDNSWLDVGQWHEFRRTMNIIKDKPDQN